MQRDSKSVLWANLVALMEHHYGKENLTRLASEVGFSPGTSSRLKKQETSVGLDVVDRIAEKFKLESWQLLVPDFNPKKLPAIGNVEWPFNRVDKKRYEALAPEDRGFAQGEMMSAIRSCEVDVGNRRVASGR